MTTQKKLYFQKLSGNAYSPIKVTDQSAGFDLRSAYDYTISPRGKELIWTDLAVQVPLECYGRIAPRSGLALKHHIDVGAGVIDSDYRGNVGVILFNHSSEQFIIRKGDRIAQLICERIVEPQLEEVISLDDTVRGDRGFGSTGGISEVDNTGAAGSSSASICYSLTELIRIIYSEGINSVTQWEAMVDNMETFILDQPKPIVNIYFTLVNAISNFFINIDSQVKVIKLKDKKISFEELMKLFESEISEETLNTQSLNFEYIIYFKEQIKKFTKTMINLN